MHVCYLLNVSNSRYPKALKTTKLFFAVYHLE